MDNTNLYKELNISPDANEQVIMQALKRKAQSGEYTLERITEIKEILTNPQKRAAYNQALLQQETIDNDEIQQQVNNRTNISYKPSFVFIVCILGIIGFLVYFYATRIYPYQLFGGEKEFYSKNGLGFSYMGSVEKEFPKQENHLITVSQTADDNKNIITLNMIIPNGNHNIHSHKDAEKRIAWVNTNLSKLTNQDMQAKIDKINNHIRKDKSEENAYLSRVSLNNNNKLMITGAYQSYIFNLDNKDDKVIEIPIGALQFLDDRYVVLDNSYSLSKSKEMKRKICHSNYHDCGPYSDDGEILFFDFSNNEISKIRIYYNVNDFEIIGYEHNTLMMPMSKKLFIDKKGNKLGIILRIISRDIENNLHVNGKLYVYEIEKNKDIINSVNKIWEKDFQDTFIEYPIFSDDGKELYFVKTPPSKVNFIYDYVNNLSSKKQDIIEFVRWSLKDDKLISSSRINTYSLINLHFDAKKNRLFAVGIPDENANILSDEPKYHGYKPQKVKKWLDKQKGNVYAFYYHDLHQREGYISSSPLMYKSRGRILNCNGFLFSNNGYIVEPLCSNAGGNGRYFLYNESEPVDYRNKMERMKNSPIYKFL
ncbi:MAG: hypothetical protein IK065_05380 [Neisseriaceae bacterium]|nr:hypothetical protein [Neisseriaceae bacterium]